MPAELPYLSSYKNVGKLFEKIYEAKIPDAFTHKFLETTIGLKGTGDRPLISLLRNLEFIDGSNKPTATYPLLKNKSAAPFAIATAVRKAYAPLFEANEKAHELSGEALRGLISQVAGSDAGMTGKISGTFNSIVKLANFTQPTDQAKDKPDLPEKTDEGLGDQPPAGHKGGRAFGFHYNIQIHLPSNGTEETYLNIFGALRKAFG